MSILSVRLHHHFKYADHGIAGQAHIHFFGTDAFSFGGKIVLQKDDLMVVEWKGMGRALKNRLEVCLESEKMVAIGRVN